MFTEITTLNEWQEVLAKSQTELVLLFKHSTTCPISAAAFREFTAFESSAPSYLVKVIESRQVSNEIAEDVQVVHQSPQILLLKNGQAVWTESHYSITQTAINAAVHANVK